MEFVVPVQLEAAMHCVSCRMKALKQHTCPPGQSFGPSQSYSKSFGVLAQVVPIGVSGWHSAVVVVAW
jgi:hypothetical protein